MVRPAVDRQVCRGVLVSPRRDRAVVTGCLACRGDQYERAVRASTGIQAELPGVNSCSIHPAGATLWGSDRVSGGAIGDKMSEWEQPLDALLGASQAPSGQ